MKTKEKYKCPSCLDDYLSETRTKCYACNGRRKQKDETNANKKNDESL